MLIKSLLSEETDDSDSSSLSESVKQMLLKTIHSQFQPRETFKIEELEHSLRRQYSTEDACLDRATLLRYLQEMVSAHILRTIVPNQSFKLVRDISSDSITDVVKTIRKATLQNPLSASEIAKQNRDDKKHAHQTVRAAVDVLLAIGNLKPVGGNALIWDEEQEGRNIIMQFYLDECARLREEIETVKQQRRRLEEDLKTSTQELTNDELSLLI